MNDFKHLLVALFFMFLAGIILGRGIGKKEVEGDLTAAREAFAQCLKDAAANKKMKDVPIPPPVPNCFLCHKISQ